MKFNLACRRLEDARFALANVENAVRLFLEVRYLAWGARERSRLAGANSRPFSI
jgi:hypothetical protein